MSRSIIVAKVEKKPMNPVWRGIGCVTFVFVAVASFFLSAWLIDWLTSCRPAPISTWFVDLRGAVPGCEAAPNLPQQVTFLPSALRQMTTQFKGQFPWFGGMGRYVPSILFSLVTSLLLFGVIGVIYAIFRGDHTDPKDVRNWEPPGRRKRRVRKCR
jgi:hypothetical protein